MFMDKRTARIHVLLGSEEKKNLRQLCFDEGITQSTFALEAIRERIARLRVHEQIKPTGTARPTIEPAERYPDQVGGLLQPMPNN